MEPEGGETPPTIATIRTAQRGNQRLVELTDGTHYVFATEAIDEAGVREGSVASPDLVAKLESADRRAVVHEAALRLLATRARSEQEMRTRLAMRGIDPEAIEHEIQRLLRSSLLDDSIFAHAWVRHRQQTAPRSRRMLRHELLGRGISPESADEVTAELDDCATALEVARRRAQSRLSENYEQHLTKIGGFLRRRGFTYAISSEAARQTWDEIEQDRSPA